MTAAEVALKRMVREYQNELRLRLGFIYKPKTGWQFKCKNGRQLFGILCILINEIKPEGIPVESLKRAVKREGYGASSFDELIQGLAIEGLISINNSHIVVELQKDDAKK